MCQFRVYQLSLVESYYDAFDKNVQILKYLCKYLSGSQGEAGDAPTEAWCVMLSHKNQRIMLTPAFSKYYTY